MESPENGSKSLVRFNKTQTVVSQRDVELQRITINAYTNMKSPITFISLISGDHQRLVTSIGLKDDEHAHLSLICKRVLLQLGDPLVILDTHKDKTYSRFSAVSAPPFVRFYIGISLVNRAGYGLGTLCIADTIAHKEAPDLTTLKQLAREAERIITNW